MLLYLLGRLHCLASVTVLSQSTMHGVTTLSCHVQMHKHVQTILCLNVAQRPLLKSDSCKHQSVSMHAYAATAVARMCYCYRHLMISTKCTLLDVCALKTPSILIYQKFLSKKKHVYSTATA